MNSAAVVMVGIMRPLRRTWCARCPTWPSPAGRRGRTVRCRGRRNSAAPVHRLHRACGCATDRGEDDIADVPGVAAAAEQAELCVLAGGQPEADVEVVLGKDAQLRCVVWDFLSLTQVEATALSQAPGETAPCGGSFSNPGWLDASILEVLLALE